MWHIHAWKGLIYLVSYMISCKGGIVKHMRNESTDNRRFSTLYKKTMAITEIILDTSSTNRHVKHTFAKRFKTKTMYNDNNEIMQGASTLIRPFTRMIYYTVTVAILIHNLVKPIDPCNTMISSSVCLGPFSTYSMYGHPPFTDL